MKTSRWLWRWILGGVLLVLVACSLPSDAATSAPPSEVPPALVTAAAQTAVAAALTQQAPAATLAPTLPPAPAATLTPSPLPPPSATPTLTPSPLPTATPTMTLTPTPSTPMISVSVDTNCRSGPGKAYDRVGALLVGETAEVLARDPSGLFWYIPNPDNPGGFCWVWGQYATIEGDTASLPVFTPPPTPTPAPAFVIKGITPHNCWGPAFYIEISNTGETNWESYRITGTDLVASRAATLTDNRFVAANQCNAPLSVNVLKPGEGAYIAFHIDGISTQHNVRFVITLYTQDNQSGQYLTQTIEYHP